MRGGRHLHRTTCAHPAVLGGRRQRQRRCPRDGVGRDARLQRVAVPAGARRGRGGAARGRRGEPLSGSGGGGAAAGAVRALRLPGRINRGGQRVVRDPAGRGRGAARALERARVRVALLLDVPAPRGRHGREGAHRRAHGLLRARPGRDRGAGQRPHAAGARLQPEQPDRHVSGLRRDRLVPGAGPAARARDPRRGLHRVPDRRGPRHLARPAARLQEPRPAAHLLQGLRPRRPAGRIRARLGGVQGRGRPRAPALLRQQARPGRGDRGAQAPGQRRGPGRVEHRGAAVDGGRSCTSSA